MDLLTLRIAGTLLALAPLAPAGELADLAGVDFKRNQPEVWFDLPPSVVVRETAETDAETGERLITVELPVSVLVNRGDIGRVQEIVVTVDGAGAGLTVHDYAPTTRLESEFTSDIEQQTTSDTERRFEASLGGRLPVGGAVAQITPGAALGRASQEVEVEKRARRAPKRAVVVASPINQRRGVLFKFRPYSQTTLEGEHALRVTFVAPADWAAGTLDVDCQATGRRKVLFVDKPTTWSQVMTPVALRLAGEPPNIKTEHPRQHSAAKAVIDDPPNPQAQRKEQAGRFGYTAWLKTSGR